MTAGMLPALTDGACAAVSLPESRGTRWNKAPARALVSAGLQCVFATSNGLGPVWPAKEALASRWPWLTDMGCLGD